MAEPVNIMVLSLYYCF